MTTPPTIDTMHDPEALDVLSRSVDHVLGRHLGAMLGSDEAAVLLDHLEAQGYTLTPIGETQHSPVTESLYDMGGTLGPDVHIHVHTAPGTHPATIGAIVGAARLAATTPLPTPQGVGESTS